MSVYMYSYRRALKKIRQKLIFIVGISCDDIFDIFLEVTIMKRYLISTIAILLILAVTTSVYAQGQAGGRDQQHGDQRSSPTHEGSGSSPVNVRRKATIAARSAGGILRPS